MTPPQPILKKNEGFVYNNLLDKRKKVRPKFQVNDVVRTADLKKTFSNSDTTHWSYKFNRITETINDSIPNYKVDNLPERYNEALLKKTALTMKENNTIMKKVIFS